MSLKRKYIIDDIDYNNEFKKLKIYIKCNICNLDNNNSDIIKINCGHYCHIYCLLYIELYSFILYTQKFQCNICKQNIQKDFYNVNSKINIYNLINYYFEIYKNILNKQKKLFGRDFYEYKRNIFYMITKQIKKKLNCNIIYQNNVTNNFIININNNYINEDILVTKFDNLIFNNEKIYN